MQEIESFQSVVDSKRKFFDLHIRETFQYRDLIFLFVKRDFVSQYKQTILGPLWAIVQPLLTTIVFTVVFGNMARLTTADVEGDFEIPGFLFYMSGCICWTFFSSIVSTTSYTFIANQSTMGKVYYPRLVAPIASSLSQLISFGIQIAMLAILWLIVFFKGGSSLRLTPAILTAPLIILQMMVLSIGLGITISAVTTKYRDLTRLVGFGLQLWQYSSPIAYGLTLVPSSSLSWYMLNPMTPIVTTFRYVFLGFGYFNLAYYLISWVISLFVFFVGLSLFSRIERTFMDTI